MFLILSLDIPENNLEREFLWYLAFHPTFHVWQNSSSWVLARDALNWSDYRIPGSLISHKWIIIVAYWLGLVWLKMTKCFKWSAMYPEDKMWSSFLCILVSVNGGSYEISVVCSSLTPSVSLFKIFLRSRWFIFPDYFPEATLLYGQRTDWT